MQYNLGIHQREGRFYKAELYYKDYDRLALEEADTDMQDLFLTSSGYEYSKGIDLFFRDGTARLRQVPLRFRCGHHFSGAFEVRIGVTVCLPFNAMAKRRIRSAQRLSVS